MAGAKEMNKFLLWLVFIYLVIFPFGQLGRIELISPITLHLVDVVAGLFVFFWLISIVQRRALPNPPLKKEFLVFLAVAGFSLLLGATKVAWQEAFVGFLYWLRFAIYVLFYFGVWDLVRQEKALKTKLFDSLIITGAFIAGFGLFQYFIFPDLRPLLLYGWDEHYFRLVGTFLDPGFTGILLVLFLVIVFSRSEWARLDSARQGRLGEKPLLSFLGIGTLLLTYSRASYLSFLVMAVAFYIVRRKFKLTIGVLIFFIVGTLLLPNPGGEGVRLERTSTISARFVNYSQALEIAKKYPLFGAGFNLYPFGKKSTAGCGQFEENTPCHSAFGSDSSLLFVLATTGTVGLIAYLALYIKMLLLGWKKRRTVFGTVLFASTIALLVHSNFSNSMFYPWILGWQAILLGIQED